MITKVPAVKGILLCWVLLRIVAHLVLTICNNYGIRNNVFSVLCCLKDMSYFVYMVNMKEWIDNNEEIVW